MCGRGRDARAGSQVRGGGERRYLSPSICYRNIIYNSEKRGGIDRTLSAAEEEKENNRAEEAPHSLHPSPSAPLPPGELQVTDHGFDT